MTETPRNALSALAAVSGVLQHWTDAAGQEVEVAQDDLRAVLCAIGVEADTESAVEISLEAARGPQSVADALLTAWCEGFVDLPMRLGRGPATLRLEGGGALDAEIVQSAAGLKVRAPSLPGYYVLEGRGGAVRIAAAPRGGSNLKGRGFGLAAQIYALNERRGDRSEGFGDFGDVAQFAGAAGAHGADAFAVSPAHALFLADPGQFQPYAPSSRLFLNGLFADAETLRPGAPAFQPGPLINWETAGPEKVRRLRAAFAQMQQEDPKGCADFAEFRRRRGASLERHVLFEALDAELRTKGVHGRAGWPKAFLDPASSAVEAFALGARQEMAFHAFVQFRAHQARAGAQAQAISSGMRIGLIADLAVGVHPGGSDVWSRPGEFLTGAQLGAPPDLFQADGQNWGILGFDPRAMRANGFALFLETLRANLQDVGGLRIDHAMGLRRLWVTPHGAPASKGAYLSCPEADLLRLIALESARARALIVGEDLGTVPQGFRGRLAEAGVLGMSVLWFEREGAVFRAPSLWGPGAIAMTSTHDLATVAGWWRGGDLSWRARLCQDETVAVKEREARVDDRTSLWRSLLEAGAVVGAEPSVDDPAMVVDGALTQMAATPCTLALAPVEDLLGLEEQVNLPGDVEIHPNWRRRLTGPAADLFADAAVAERLKILAGRRKL